MQGFLYKQSKEQWKKRFVVITTNKLKLFKDESQEMSMGVIHLTSASTIVEKSETEFDLISSKGATYHFKSDNSCDQWVAHLTAVCAGAGADTERELKDITITIPTAESANRSAATGLPAEDRKGKGKARLDSLSPSTANEPIAAQESQLLPAVGSDSRATIGVPQARLQVRSKVSTAADDLESIKFDDGLVDNINVLDTTLNKPQITQMRLLHDKGTLRLVRKYVGPEEDPAASTIEWLRSEDGGVTFTPITNRELTGSVAWSFRPTVDDFMCDIRVRYTPIAKNGSIGDIKLSDAYRMKLEASFFSTFAQIFLQGFAVFVVTTDPQGEASSEYAIVLNKQKLKIRRPVHRTITKVLYNSELNVSLDPSDDRAFELYLGQDKKRKRKNAPMQIHKFWAATAANRDGIVLSIRLFNALGTPEMVQHILGGAGRRLWASFTSSLFTPEEQTIRSFQDQVPENIVRLRENVPKGIWAYRRAIDCIMHVTNTLLGGDDGGAFDTIAGMAAVAL